MAIPCSPLYTVTLDEQIACVAREIALRERVYPGFVKKGRMKQEQADIEIARMRSVIATLNAVKDTPPTGEPSRTVIDPAAAWPFPTS